MSGGSKNKAKDRQSRKNEGYYTRQKDVSILNKVISVAQHIARYGDVKQKDVLRKFPTIVLVNAAKKLHRLNVLAGTAESQCRARAVLLALAK